MLGPIGSENILLNLGRNQQNLGNLTSRLASGLRIQTAADDPSGLAISENFRSHIAGLQQSVENVQTGGNLLTVADGAAGTIQQILQRINSLIVESNSDINSNEQLSAIQTEIDQGLLEINRIAQNANFNGLHLFDGSHDTYVAPPPGQQNVQTFEINPGPLPDGTTSTGDSVSNPQTSPSGQLMQSFVNGQNVFVQEQNASPIVTGLFILQITQTGNNLSDPVLGQIPGSDYALRQVIYGTSNTYSANGTESEFTQVFNSGTGPAPGQSEQVPSGANSFNFDMPNISAADQGVSMGIEILAPRQSGGGTAIGINDGGQEGSTVSISLPTLNTSALDLTNISVLRPTMVDDNSFSATFGQSQGVDSSNQYAAMDAQARVDAAIDNVSQVRATIGAQIVATQEDASNDNTAIVNFQATESSIRDLNVGTATTEFTREQILNSVGTSVLAQSEVSARQLTALLISAIVA